MKDYGCADLDEVAVDLALGTLTGGDRSRALAHLDWCSRCRGTVDELNQAAGALLLLAPEEPPTLGFETRVATGIAAAAGGPRRARRWRRSAVAAALAAAAVGGAMAGHLTTPESRSPGVRVALAVADGGKDVCRVVVIPGSPSQLVVTIDETGELGPADYVVEAELPNGAGTEPVGSLHLNDGHGVLSVALPAGGDGVRSVRAFQSDQLRYEALFK